MFKNFRVLAVSTSLFFQAWGTLGGVESGNTDWWLPVNSRGQRIETSYGTEHPAQKKLLELIGKAELPEALKAEMFADLEQTSILYSNETISFTEAAQQYIQVLRGVEKVITKKKGRVTEEVIYELYEVNEIEPDRRVFFEPVDYVYSNNKQWLMAYTMPEKNLVVYFKDFIPKKEAKKMKLTLHEMGHRLRFLDPIRHSERKIKAWASSTLSFLQGNLLKAQYDLILKREGLTHNPRVSFKDVTYQTLSDRFETKISVEIKPEDIIVAEKINQWGNFVVQVKTKPFYQHPEFMSLPHIDIVIPSPADTYRNGASYLFNRKYWDQFLLGTESMKLSLIVNYTQKTIDTAAGRRVDIHIEEVTADFSDRISQIRDTWSKELGLSPYFEGTFGRDETTVKDMQALAVKIKKAVAIVLKKDSEFKYSPRYIGVGEEFDVFWDQSHFKYGVKGFQVNPDEVSALTVDDIVKVLK